MSSYVFTRDRLRIELPLAPFDLILELSPHLEGAFGLRTASDRGFSQSCCFVELAGQLRKRGEKPLCCLRRKTQILRVFEESAEFSGLCGIFQPSLVFTGTGQGSSPDPVENL